jgi:hypothetical protein
MSGLALIWHDVLAVGFSTEIIDFAWPMFFALWLVLLWIPLIGIDRRDHVCAMVYVMYLMGAAAMFMFALPEQFMEPMSFLHMNGVLVLVGVVAAARWYYWRPNSTLVKEVTHGS